MSFLLHVFLAFAGIAAAEEGLLGGALFLGRPIPGAFLAALLLAVPQTLAHLARRAARDGRLRLAGFGAFAARISPPLLFLVVLGPLGWHALVSSAAGDGTSLAAWPGPELVLVLLPWVALEACAIDARARLHAPPGPQRAAWRRLHARFLLGAMLPVIVYLTISGVVARIEPLRVRIEEIGFWSAGYSFAMLCLVALVLPLLLRYAWTSRRFESGEFVERVFRLVAERADFACRGLYLWDTSGTMANAAIVGIGPWQRRVFVSDALLARLAPTELAAVFAHEIAHAKKHHVVVFAAWAIAWVLGLETLVNHLAQTDFRAAEASSGAVMFAGLIVGALAFGFVSRRVELQADAWAARLLGTPAPMIGALLKVGGPDGTRDGFRHFGTERRVRFLQRIAQVPALARRLDRGLAAFAAVGALALLLALVARGRALAADLLSERLRTDLRLGHWSKVLAAGPETIAAVGGEEIAPYLAEIERWRADGELEEAHGREFFADRARQALLATEPGRALVILELGVLRGHDDLVLPARALRAILDGEATESSSGQDGAGPRGEAPWTSLLDDLRSADDP